MMTKTRNEIEKKDRRGKKEVIQKESNKHLYEAKIKEEKEYKATYTVERKIVRSD